MLLLNNLRNMLCDDIPLCSEEMETNCEAGDAYHDYDTASTRRRFDFYERREELSQKATELDQYVPE